MNIEKVNFYLKQTLVSTVHDIDSDHIKAVEKIIRNSYEYRKYLGDKRENCNENSCAYLKDFDFSKNKASLELHHVIFLADLVEIGYKVLLDKGEKFISTSQVADLVLSWHYENIIPYIFLSRTMHQLYHSNQYSFNFSDIKGNYTEFISRYSDFLTPNAEKTILNKGV